MTPNPRRQTNIRLDEEILDGLQHVKDRDGMPISEQVRRALRAWLDSRRVTEAVALRRARTGRKAASGRI